MESSPSSTEKPNFRAKVLSGHLTQQNNHPPILQCSLSASPCLSYTPPEVSEPGGLDVWEMRKLMDGHNLQDRDWLYGIMIQSHLFNPRERGGKVFVAADYNQNMEQQREMTMRRIGHLLDCGVFKGWLTENGPESELRKLALLDVIALFDHSLSVKLGVHFILWGGAIQFLGTKRHHDEWLRDTENYAVKGCFAMTELGHGSNVRGIETVTTYDSRTGEFVINTPCESAQKYWIGGAANHATHTIVFSQLKIDGKDQGVHAFIAQIRDANGNICPNIRIADCGHKIGLNGVDNGRIWFDNVRVPRENLLNSVADVSHDGKYLTAIKDPDRRFGAFMAPLTTGRVTIPSIVTYSAKVGIAIAIRYSLTRRAFSVTPNGPEVLLLDYPSHQRRLLPLLAKTYAMSFAANFLKRMYVKRKPEMIKTLHVVSSAFKATLSWHNMRTLQECREACGGQGLKTENRIGQAKSEYDVHSTFEGDNNVLMQQVSKALLAEYVTCKRKGKAFKGLGLEHMNEPCPVIPSKLSSDTLGSIQFQNDIFCLRERHLLNLFAAEVSQHQASGEGKENAFLLSYQLAEDLGRAFADRTIYHTFVNAEPSVNSGSLKNILSLVRSMYAMAILDEDAAFLRYGCLTTDNAAAVRKEIATLCSELRPHALALVTSFGIPDAFLSPIAFNWIDSNAWSSL
ncbi:PREDICTED: acyl-coenzyme A oxidase 3, peroxisomal-like [Ipomoea nil]|uniref:acyl-coenzyme A oxidase 3, peroxisomal-like n=1 Tax=Ipomoea nil TaxID=35883 RepID=UPI000900BB4B|nr:PREDICTED: acyl-coenzyme A oxidase 3, peroxisomal-like [Ipomoea nil]